MDGWMDERTDGWVGGRIDFCELLLVDHFHWSVAWAYGVQ